MNWHKYHCAVPVKVNTLETPLFRVRSAMENRLGSLQSGSLLNALVLGNPLPLRIQEQAIKTGILHVFAISGLQTTLLMGYVYRWSKNKIATMLLGLVLIIFYGFSASVLRSVLMYGVMLSIPKGRKLGLGGVAAAGLAASCLDPLFFTRHGIFIVFTWRSCRGLLGRFQMVKRENQLYVITCEPAFLSFYFAARCFFYCATCTSVHVVVRTWHFVCDYATKTTKLLS